MNKLDTSKALYWLVFSPLIVPLALLLGAFDGLQKIVEQAKSDLFQVEERAY